MAPARPLRVPPNSARAKTNALRPLVPTPRRPPPPPPPAAAEGPEPPSPTSAEPNPSGTPRRLTELDTGGTWLTTHDLYFTSHVGKHPNLAVPPEGAEHKKSKQEVVKERLALTPREMRRELHDATLYSNVFFTHEVRDGYCLPEGNGLEATEKPPPRRSGDNRPPWRRISNSVPEAAPIGKPFYPRRRQPTVAGR